MYPPRRSFYEILSDQFNGTRDSLAVSRGLSVSLSKGELEVLSTRRGPLTLFRRGETLALMPFQFLR